MRHTSYVMCLVLFIILVSLVCIGESHAAIDLEAVNYHYKHILVSHSFTILSYLCLSDIPVSLGRTSL